MKIVPEECYKPESNAIQNERINSQASIAESIWRQNGFNQLNQQNERATDSSTNLPNMTLDGLGSTMDRQEKKEIDAAKTILEKKKEEGYLSNGGKNESLDNLLPEVDCIPANEANNSSDSQSNSSGNSSDSSSDGTHSATQPSDSAMQSLHESQRMRDSITDGANLNNQLRRGPNGVNSMENPRTNK